MFVRVDINQRSREFTDRSSNFKPLKQDHLANTTGDFMKKVPTATCTLRDR